MSEDKSFSVACPLPSSTHPEVVLAHGGGGAMTQQLFDQVILPAFENPILNAGHDGAALDIDGARLAFSTDSYVVKPCFFPGGDIGSLAVHGTVNDLAMCGARPLFLSVALILEEGLMMDDLHRIIASMGSAARQAGVQLVTGDTKVVDRGSGDQIFINTSGIGLLQTDRPISPTQVRPDDAILISGDIGRHGMAVMTARKELAFDTPILSDSAALADIALSLIQAGVDVHCMRDPTRGGLATTLVEIAGSSGLGISLDENAVPLSNLVRGACEILGIDPLYVANEGCFVAFVPHAQADQALALLKANPQGREASIIGHVHEKHRGVVVSSTSIGSTRVLDRLSGEQLPRIC